MKLSSNVDYLPMKQLDSVFDYLAEPEKIQVLRSSTFNRLIMLQIRPTRPSVSFKNRSVHSVPENKARAVVVK